MSVDLEAIFSSSILRWRSSPQEFGWTEEELSVWSELPESGLSLDFESFRWNIVRGATESELVGIVDQGLRQHDDWDGWRAPFTYSQVRSYIEGDVCDRESRKDPYAGEDDFWFRAIPHRSEMLVCLGLPDRAYVQCNSPSVRFISYDKTCQGDPVSIWDPGACDIEIPSQFFIPKEWALNALDEFWHTGSVSQDTNYWYNPLLNTQAEHGEGGKASPATS
jgi:hypothetical protein